MTLRCFHPEGMKEISRWWSEARAQPPRWRLRCWRRQVPVGRAGTRPHRRMRPGGGARNSPAPPGRIPWGWWTPGVRSFLARPGA